MKVIIDLIESLADEIDNQGDFSFLAMLLKQNSGGDMELIGEKPVSRIGIASGVLTLYVDVEERTVFVEPVRIMLEGLSNEEMMCEVKVSVSNQTFDVLGFGKSDKDKKFVLFIESKS